MSKISGQFLISGQFQDICKISGISVISGQLGALKITHMHTHTKSRQIERTTITQQVP